MGQLTFGILAFLISEETSLVVYVSYPNLSAKLVLTSVSRILNLIEIKDVLIYITTCNRKKVTHSKSKSSSLFLMSRGGESKSRFINLQSLHVTLQVI